MQVSPEKYKSLVSGLKLVLKEEGSGTKGIWKGWLPTFFGYSAQGLCKFGFYEIFKDLYMNMAGEHNSCTYTGVIWLAGSASAEFFADIALCPMEMVKVKVQTSPAGTWPTDFGAALKQMAAQKATTGFPFGSVVPLWSRQIPYTMAKYAFISVSFPPSPLNFFQLVLDIFRRFFFFERIVQLFYQHVFTKPKDTYSKGVYQNARSAIL